MGRPKKTCNAPGCLKPCRKNLDQCNEHAPKCVGDGIRSCKYPIKWDQWCHLHHPERMKYRAREATAASRTATNRKKELEKERQDKEMAEEILLETWSSVDVLLGYVRAMGTDFPADVVKGLDKAERRYRQWRKTGERTEPLGA